MTKHARLFPAFTVLCLLACGGDPADVRESLARVDAMGTPSEALTALVGLDQSHPNALGVKLRLGELYMRMGEPDAAAAYLSRARELAGRRGVPREEALRAVREYGQLLIALNRPAEAINVVARAAAAGDARALLVRGRASVQLGDTKAALADFRAAWDAEGVSLAGADYVLHSQALAAEGMQAEALEMLRACERKLGYQPGTGLLESSLEERLGLTVPSILAAFKETLYQETQAAISRDQIDANLAALAARTDVAGMGGETVQLLVRGLDGYLHGRWAEAAGSLGRGLDGVDDPFGAFLLLACSLEGGTVTVDALARYAALEPRYRTYPHFYYHMWRAMKRGPGRYTLPNARGVLERTILLAPACTLAAESRRELGRLVGVGPAEAGDILVGAELDLVYARLRAGADPRPALAPVLRLLSISRENVYTSDGLLMVRSAAEIPAVGAYLSEQAEKAGGVLKERLSQIL